MRRFSREVSHHFRKHPMPTGSDCVQFKQLLKIELGDAISDADAVAYRFPHGQKPFPAAILAAKNSFFAHFNQLQGEFFRKPLKNVTKTS